MASLASDPDLSLQRSGLGDGSQVRCPRCAVPGVLSLSLALVLTSDCICNDNLQDGAHAQ